MRILWVAPLYDYGDPRRGLGFEETNLASALRGMGHEVVHFDFLHEYREHGRRKMNRRLVEAASWSQPDLAFFFLYRYEVKRKTVRQISRLGVPTLNWFADDHWRFDDFSRFYAPVFDWVSTTDEAAMPKYRAIGYHHALLTQYACNRHSYRRVAYDKRYDVTFIGQPHSDRRQIIERLAQAGIQVECFGHGWPNGRVSHEKMIEIFSTSRINLNLSGTSSAGQEQIKGRVFEVPGCGGFLLTGPAAGLDRYLTDGRDCAVYHDFDDLVHKIRHYLDHEDERLAIELAGERRVLEEHTYDHRLAEIFARMGMDGSTPNDFPPIESPIDVGWRSTVKPSFWTAYDLLVRRIGEDRVNAAFAFGGRQVRALKARIYRHRR